MKWDPGEFSREIYSTSAVALNRRSRSTQYFYATLIVLVMITNLWRLIRLCAITYAPGMEACLSSAV